MAEEDETPTNYPPVVGRIERGESMPVCVIMVGMVSSYSSYLLCLFDELLIDSCCVYKKAGSGKTTLLTQLQRSLDGQEEEVKAEKAPEQQAENEKPAEESCYCVNLDPATISMPYDVSIDIRDTVDYHQVMRQHKLGPNGAIMTSLNLFATKFDQVMSILEKRAYEPEDEAPPSYILLDTPGQIEAFTWSASGQIISESLASAFPTVLCFVVDTVRCASSPNTFMSNMLYAASMLYRTRLPLVVC
jgi:GTPase SAR1 family protein